MEDTTDWGFPKGRVASTLRSILHPDLTDHDVEAIVVCLLAHLLVESRLNEVLYAWLRQDAPKAPAYVATRTDDALSNSVSRMNFATKCSLILPFFEVHAPKEAATVRELNELRNKVFHGRAIKEATFRGKPLSDEATIEQVFLAAQFVTMELGKFQETIDLPHALAEHWSKRLLELGEPLI